MLVADVTEDGVEARSDQCLGPSIPSEDSEAPESLKSSVPI